MESEGIFTPTARPRLVVKYAPASGLDHLREFAVLEWSLRVCVQVNQEVCVKDHSEVPQVSSFFLEYRQSLAIASLVSNSSAWSITRHAFSVRRCGGKRASTDAVPRKVSSEIGVTSAAFELVAKDSRKECTFDQSSKLTSQRRTFRLPPFSLGMASRISSAWSRQPSPRAGPHNS